MSHHDYQNRLVRKIESLLAQLRAARRAGELWKQEVSDLKREIALLKGGKADVTEQPQSRELDILAEVEAAAPGELQPGSPMGEIDPASMKEQVGDEDPPEQRQLYSLEPEPGTYRQEKSHTLKDAVLGASGSLETLQSTHSDSTAVIEGLKRQLKEQRQDYESRVKTLLLKFRVAQEEAEKVAYQADRQ